jgi:hypothetical protein
MLRLHDITIDNFQRLTSVEMEFDDLGNLIIVGGRNEQGKSSFLDALQFLFVKGAPSAMPIHEGAKKAEVVATLCNDEGEIVYTITKRALKSGQEITVKDAEGHVIPDAYTLFGDLTAKGYGFDPVAFCEAGNTAPGRRQQAETLRQLLGLDFTDHDANRKRLFDERTGVNVEVKRLEGVLSGLTFHEGAPAEELSLQDLSDSYAEATRGQMKYQAVLGRFNGMKAAMAETQQRIERLRAELAEAEQSLAQQTEEAKALAEEGKGIKAALTDPEPIKAAMDTVDATNRKVRENKQHTEIAAQLAVQRARSEELTNLIEACDESKALAIATAPMPIPELSVSDDEVLYQGRPLSVASTAGKLRVAVAIGIAMLKELKVILIRQGAALDSTNLRLIGEMADKAGVQVFVERPMVRGASFVIDNGAIPDRETVTLLAELEG